MLKVKQPPFVAPKGVQELTCLEIGFVAGADADAVKTIAAFTGAGARIVAVAAGGPTNPVGAIATAVVVVSIVAGGVALLMDED